MNRGCVRPVAVTLAILSLSLWVGEATLAGPGEQDRESRIHQKMERPQTLVQERQQEGADLQPVGELMQGFEPLIQEQKFSEAEALLAEVVGVSVETQEKRARFGICSSALIRVIKLIDAFPKGVEGNL